MHLIDYASDMFSLMKYTKISIGPRNLPYYQWTLKMWQYHKLLLWVFEYFVFIQEFLYQLSALNFCLSYLFTLQSSSCLHGIFPGRICSDKIYRLYRISLLVTFIWSLRHLAILQVMLQKIHSSLQRNTLHFG